MSEQAVCGDSNGARYLPGLPILFFTIASSPPRAWFPSCAPTRKEQWWTGRRRFTRSSSTPFLFSPTIFHLSSRSRPRSRRLPIASSFSSACPSPLSPSVPPRFSFKVCSEVLSGRPDFVWRGRSLPVMNPPHNPPMRV